MALPNLPGEHIQGTFEWLEGKCPTFNMAEVDPDSSIREAHFDGLKQMLRYFSRNWINNAQVLPASWSNYKRTVRTNNDVEGWHQRLNGSSPVAHPNMYFLIFLLQGETDRFPVQIRQVAQDQVIRRCRKETALKNARLAKLWEEYDAKTKTTSQFLRDCGALADHNERD